MTTPLDSLHTSGEMFDGVSKKLYGALFAPPSTNSGSGVDPTTSAMGAMASMAPMAPMDITLHARILGQIADAVVVIDGAGQVVYWNAAAERLYDLPAASALGKPISACFEHEWTSPEAEQQAAEAVQKSGEWHGEGWHLTLQGKRIYVAASVSLLRDERGAAAGLLGINRDETLRKHAELRLQESEERFRSLSESSPIGIFVATPDGRCVWTNPLLQRIGDFTDAEASGNGWFYFVHPDDAADVLTQWLAYINHQPPSHSDRAAGPDGGFSGNKETGDADHMLHLFYRFMHHDGEVRWVENRIMPFRSGAGKPLGHVGIVTDITEQKQMGDDLLASREQVVDTLESITDAFFSLDRDWQFIYANRHAEDFLHVPQGSLIGKTLWDVFPGITGTEFHKQYERVMLNRATVYFEAYHAPLGKWFEARAYPSGNGGITVYFNDSTERMLTEKKIQRDDHLFREAQRIAHLGIWQWDISTGRITWSDELYRICGIEPCNITPESYLHYVHPDDQELFARRAADAITLGRSFTAESRVIHPDGSIRWVFTSVEVQPDENGQTAKLIGIVSDRTEQKEAEAEKETLMHQLLHAQKMEAVGTLASGIAHDFNNILTGIMGNLELLRAVLPPGDAVQQKRASRISEGAERASKLTRQILGFSRQGKLHVQPVSLSECINSVTGLLEPTLDRRIRFITTDLPQLPYIEADRSQIEQIIMNLAVNAADAISGTLAEKGSGAITFRLSQDFPEHFGIIPAFSHQGRAFIHLSVSDTGTGIDAAIRQKIFEPFFTTKGIGKGTGLGLSMVYGIVGSHHGYITLETAVGTGTTFHLFFPPVVSDPAKPATINTHDMPAAVLPSSVSSTVLVIDDDYAVREVAAELLAHAGYTVLTAADGKSGAALYAAHPHGRIDLVVLDMNMPVMNGAETFRHLQSHHPQVKVLLSTGYADAAPVHELIKAGILGVLAKPYNADTLIAAVRSALQTSSTHIPPDAK